ncbi:unnamed protein product [Didymodactylos carnosus]|uniref:FAD-binding FR-type domain-containing protein n=1 Tax=Didymodactylos carnosus TaxID=1234261 RepID=A0A8S2I549_9BILA|nr:unnamed protein product [Didymodactylos carnosus]CAF3714390.1 unnamed protein product [Didymodactylos carnosus]
MRIPNYRIGACLPSQQYVKERSNRVQQKRFKPYRKCFSNQMNSCPYQWHELMFTFAARLGDIVPGFAPLSGVILSLILVVIVIFSIGYVRRSGHFEVFYFTHLLYIPFFIFLILHGNGFYKWFCVPGTIFIIEKIYSLIQFSRSSHGHTKMKSVRIFECPVKMGKKIEKKSVIALTIHRPVNFDYRPGDYLFLHISKIAKFEWHPFTISSGPEEKETLTLHIHAAGNWTNKLLEYLNNNNPHNTTLNHVTVELNTTTISNQQQQQQQQQVKPALSTRSFSIDDSLMIDGSYSSSARYIFDVEHVVLIAAGIGVTPYASILSSLMAQFRLQRVKCKKCAHINYTIDEDSIIRNNRVLKKVDFIWVNREMQEFLWFLNLLVDFENEQEAYLNDIEKEREDDLRQDQYITRILTENIYYERTKRDLYTNLKSRTNHGRPKWNSLFSKIQADNQALFKNKSDVHVFFCGPPAMAKTIKTYCTSPTYKFKFHKELF